MIARVETAQGNPVGCLEIEDIPEWRSLGFKKVPIEVKWTQRVDYTRGTWGMHERTIKLQVHLVIPWGPVIATKWKDRERLKRSRLLKPFVEYRWWNDETNSWKEAL